jgi:hypothetical protein
VIALTELSSLEKEYINLRGTEVKALNPESIYILNSIEITGMQSLEERKMPIKKKTTTKKKSTVNKAGNYTKPTMRKRLFEKIKAGSKGGKPGQWSARKAQLLAKQYKSKGGGYK